MTSGGIWDVWFGARNNMVSIVFANTMIPADLTAATVTAAILVRPSADVRDNACVVRVEHALHCPQHIRCLLFVSIT